MQVFFLPAKERDVENMQTEDENAGEVSPQWQSNPVGQTILTKSLVVA